jgi:hypothetical protein
MSRLIKVAIKAQSAYYASVTKAWDTPRANNHPIAAYLLIKVFGLS